MVTILFRTVIIYTLLVCVMKMMGKRQIGELEISDLVTTLMLSELAVSPISDNNIPLLYAIIPILILLSFEVILTYIITKSHLLKSLMNIKASFIINKGKLEIKELEKVRMSLDEFIEELRLKDVADLSNVNYAILESNGKMSVIPKTEQPDVGIAHPLIIDGHICPQGLEMTGHDEQWVFRKIQSEKYSLKDIFLYTVDDCGNENFIFKSY